MEKWRCSNVTHRDIKNTESIQVNAGAIFDVCQNKIQPLHDTITQIIEDIK